MAKGHDRYTDWKLAPPPSQADNLPLIGFRYCCQVTLAGGHADQYQECLLLGKQDTSDPSKELEEQINMLAAEEEQNEMDGEVVRRVVQNVI